MAKISKRKAAIRDQIDPVKVYPVDEALERRARARADRAGAARRADAGPGIIMITMTQETPIANLTT